MDGLCTTTQNSTKWLGFFRPAGYVRQKTSKRNIWSSFENDTLLQNWDNFKIALDELINE